MDAISSQTVALIAGIVAIVGVVALLVWIVVLNKRLHYIHSELETVRRRQAENAPTLRNAGRNTSRAVQPAFQPETPAPASASRTKGRPTRRAVNVPRGNAPVQRAATFDNALSYDFTNEVDDALPTQYAHVRNEAPKRPSVSGRVNPPAEMHEPEYVTPVSADVDPPVSALERLAAAASPIVDQPSKPFAASGEFQQTQDAFELSQANTHMGLALDSCDFDQESLSFDQHVSASPYDTRLAEEAARQQAYIETARRAREAQAKQQAYLRQVKRAQVQEKAAARAQQYADRQAQYQAQVNQIQLQAFAQAQAQAEAEAAAATLERARAQAHAHVAARQQHRAQFEMPPKKGRY